MRNSRISKDSPLKLYPKPRSDGPAVKASSMDKADIRQ